MVKNWMDFTSISINGLLKRRTKTVCWHLFRVECERMSTPFYCLRGAECYCWVPYDCTATTNRIAPSSRCTSVFAHMALCLRCWCMFVCVIYACNRITAWFVCKVSDGWRPLSVLSAVENIGWIKCACWNEYYTNGSHAVTSNGDHVSEYLIEYNCFGKCQYSLYAPESLSDVHCMRNACQTQHTREHTCIGARTKMREIKSDDVFSRLMQ